MTIGQKHLYINNTIWHCFSIFYSKENIAVLLNAVSDFYESNKNYMIHFSFYFSKSQGERIDNVFISEKQNSEILVAHIEQFFEQFLKEKPSENLHPIPYSSSIWIPYSNNTTLWNGFKIPFFLIDSQDIRNFSQDISLLITNLYDLESSYDENVISIATFLSIQLWKHQNISIPTITDPKLAETIQSYWNLEDEDILTLWSKYANITNKISIIYYHLNLSENIINILFK